MSITLVDKKPLSNSKKLCAKKYFGELEDIRLLTKIFHSRPQEMASASFMPFV
jgi:hypothetical protein